MGVPHENVILADSKGVVYKGRTEGMNQWKSAHAVETKARSPRRRAWKAPMCSSAFRLPAR